MKVSGSIVLFRSDVRMISEVIHSFFRGDTSGRKLFLVDNSPTDSLRTLADLYPSKIEYIFANANLGYGTANNVAMRKAMGEGYKYHIVLNPDLSFQADVIPALESFMEENPDVGGCIPDIIDYGIETRRYCARLLPTPANGVVRRFLGKSKLAEKLDNDYCLRKADFTKVFAAPYISGCFMFLRLDVLKQVGLFDERFFMYFEDVDLSRRIYAKSRTCFYPYVNVMHLGNREAYKSRKMMKIMIKSAFQYYNKYHWFFDFEAQKFNKNTLRILGLN